jgi:hypothetical protein
MVCRYPCPPGPGLGVFLVAIAILGSNSAIFAQVASKPSSTTQTKSASKPDIRYEVFYDKESGYGYDVFVDGKKLIHQPNIPGIAGTAGFKKEEHSRRVAELVVKKLERNEVPPAITRDELRQLKVID